MEFEAKGTLVLNGISYSGGASGGEGGTSDYSKLENKPQINNVELSGNKSFEDLGLGLATTEKEGLMPALLSLQIPNSKVLMSNGKWGEPYQSSYALIAGALSHAQGSATNPVYFDGQGNVKSCTYQLNATVPSDALFTDTKDASSLTCTSRVYGGGSATTSVQTALSNLADVLGTVNTLLEGAL